MSTGNVFIFGVKGLLVFSLPIVNILIGDKTITSSFDDNILKLHVKTVTDDDKEEYYKNMTNITHEIDKRKQDIISLEKDLQKLTTEIKENFDSLNNEEEQNKGLEIIRLLGQISNHNKNIKELEDITNKKYKYTIKTVTKTVDLVQNTVLFLKSDIFGFDTYVTYICESKEAPKEAPKEAIVNTISIDNIIEKVLYDVDNYKIGDTVYVKYKEIYCKYTISNITDENLYEIISFDKDISLFNVPIREMYKHPPLE